MQSIVCIIFVLTCEPKTLNSNDSDTVDSAVYSKWSEIDFFHQSDPRLQITLPAPANQITCIVPYPSNDQSDVLILYHSYRVLATVNLTLLNLYLIPKFPHDKTHLQST